MAISGINDYTSGYNFYNIPSLTGNRVDRLSENAIRNGAVTPSAPADIQVNTSPAKEELPDIDLPASALKKPVEEAPIERRPNASLEDVSLSFNKSTDYGYIGRDANIFSLDIEQAISDMQKDSILQQYQYFVGTSKSLISENADGLVIAKF